MNEPPPTFEELAKNRVLEERRFYLNNSNTKYISMGIVPSTKILSPEAPGFVFEAFLAGEKAAPLPLGGIEGLATLFATIREIPAFSRMPAIDHEVKNGEHIEISTVEFAKNVGSIFILLKQSQIRMQMFSYFIFFCISGVQNRKHDPRWQNFHC